MVGKPWGYEAYERPQFSTRPRYDEADNLLDRSFRLSPCLVGSERGGVIPPTLGVTWDTNGSISIQPGNTFNQDVVRTALLFVDKVDIPDNSNISFGCADIDELISFGIGARSTVVFEGDLGPDTIFQYPWFTYLELEKREPGRWSIWRGPNQNVVPEDKLSPSLAFQLHLTNGLIVPHKLTPYEDLLLFKERHRDELISLRHHLEELAIKLSKEGDPRAVNLERERFDVSLAEYLKKVRQSNVRKAVASLTKEFDLAAAVRSAIGGGSGGLIAASQGLSITQAAATIGGGILAGLSIKSVAGLKEGPSPFRYMARIEREYGT